MAKQTKRQAKSAAQTREYRKLYAQAKRKGLVIGDKDARSLKPTAYMRKRLRQLKPYLGDEFEVVKASPELTRVWRGAPSEIVPKTLNRKLIVKRAPGVKVSTKGGILSLRRKLDAGTFEELPLPTNVKSLNELKTWVEENRYYNDILKHRDEKFNFKIYGNPSFNNFGDLESLIGELEKYQNYDATDDNGDDWGDSPEFFAEFALFRSYKDWKWPRDLPAVQRAKDNARRERRRQRKIARMNPAERESFFDREREFRRARRKKTSSYADQKKAQVKSRKSETPDQKEARRKKHAEYMRDYRKANKE